MHTSHPIRTSHIDRQLMTWTSALASSLLLSFAVAQPVGAQTSGLPSSSRVASKTGAPVLATNSYATMLAKVIPAVVTLRVTSEVALPVDFSPGAPEQAMPPRKVVSRSGGSGVIVDAANGHIITNNHVITDATRIEVVLSDGRLLLARLVGRDIGSDLAVVEVAARDLPQVPIGNSDAVRVGDVVAAVGNPFGLEGTATLGIVSATMRTEVGHETFEDFLQIDAVINPGNSGGALVDTRGRLIGINTAAAGSVGNVGIGFAIPINMARSIKSELIRHGQMRRGTLGLLVEDLTYERAAEIMSGTNRGATISEVIPGSPAAQVGIKPGAIVTSVAGKPVRGAREFNTRVVTVPLGTRLTVEIRQEGQHRKIDLVTSALQLPAPVYTLSESTNHLAGLKVRDILPGHPLYGDQRGSEVVEVPAGRPVEKFGLKPGDIVIGVDDNHVRRTEHLFRFASRAGSGYRLRIVRQGSIGWLNVGR